MIRLLLALALISAPARPQSAPGTPPATGARTPESHFRWVEAL
jgi:hypothetical protein